MRTQREDGRLWTSTQWKALGGDFQPALPGCALPTLPTDAPPGWFCSQAYLQTRSGFRLPPDQRGGAGSPHALRRLTRGCWVASAASTPSTAATLSDLVICSRFPTTTSIASLLPACEINCTQNEKSGPFMFLSSLATIFAINCSCNNWPSQPDAISPRHSPYFSTDAFWVLTTCRTCFFLPGLHSRIAGVASLPISIAWRGGGLEMEALLLWQHMEFLRPHTLNRWQSSVHLCSLSHHTLGTFTKHRFRAAGLGNWCCTPAHGSGVCKHRLYQGSHQWDKTSKGLRSENGSYLTTDPPPRWP